MNEHQIRCFLLVAEEGSFSKAARRCAVSQPAISKTIAALEAELGVRLFFRQGNRTLALTEVGTLYLTFFQSVAAQWVALRSTIDGTRELPVLRLALPACLEGLLSPALLSQSNPELNLIAQFLPPEQISTALGKGDFDFALCLQEELSQQKQHVLATIGQSEAVILFSPAHFSPLNKPLEPADFAFTVFYLSGQEQCRSMNLWLEQACLPFGFMPRTVYLPTWAEVFSKVRAGQGVTLCYRFCSAEQLSPVELGAFRTFSLAMRRQLPPNIHDEMLRLAEQLLQ